MDYTLNPGVEKISELYYKIRCHHRTPILWKLAQLYSKDELKDELYFKEGRTCNDLLLFQMDKFWSDNQLKPEVTTVEITGALYRIKSTCFTNPSIIIDVFKIRSRRLKSVPNQ